MSKLLIIGAGGHGKVVADTAVKMNIWNKIDILIQKRLYPIYPLASQNRPLT